MVQQLRDVHLKDLLTNRAIAIGMDLPGSDKDVRSRLILDFFKLPKRAYSMFEDDEMLSSSAAQSRLVFRTKKKRSMEQVSQAQFVGVSCRILLRLMQTKNAPRGNDQALPGVLPRGGRPLPDAHHLIGAADAA